MINLIGIGVNQIAPRHIPFNVYAQHCGLLTSPRNRKNPWDAVAIGARWAADNDCYVEYHPARILRWLEQHGAIAHTCQWFNAPDVVGNARATLFMFSIWQPIIRAYGYPVAFTLQNGMDKLEIPWAFLDAIFIGGDTAFKYSAYVRNVVRKAVELGKWVHMGRVNTINRIQYARAIGCSSFDGTNYVRRPFDVAAHLNFHALARPLLLEI